MKKQKITPFLWFDGKAEEAMNFYVSIFGNSRAGKIMKGPDGSVFSVTFQLEGQPFFALNGGPQFKFTEATFGLSWQIIPTALGELLQHKDPEKAKKVMQAMMQMKRIDIAALQRAAS